MKIGILQCGHTPDAVAARHGDYDAMFRRLLDGRDLDFRTWNVVDMEFPDDVHAAEGWLLTGSKHGAYEDHAFIPPLEHFIRAAHEAGVPTVGICFGHQIVAQALGGKVVKYPGGWAVGRRSYEFDGLGTVVLNAWHQDQVVELPPGAEVIARNDFTENAALRYDDRILTIQAHPELTSPIIADYLRVRRGDPAYPPGLLAAAERDLCGPTDEPRIAEMIAGFLRQPRA